MLPLAAAALLALTAPTTPEGYLAVPKSGHGPGVLVLHAWWGLNKDIKSYCDKLARAGFEAFAPDMFHGQTAKTQAEAMALTKAAEPKDPQIRQQILEADKYLEQITGSPKIGVVSISFGVYYALWASNEDPDRIRAVVLYYGTGPGPFTESKASYLFNFAEKDEFDSQAEIDYVKNKIQAGNRPATYYTYPGTGHWFAEPSVKSAYNKEASDLAWQRTLSFLRNMLSSDSQPK
jgi:carboxymethylenebutenolidase